MSKSGRPPTIRSWSIENFKSIRKATLELAPLTLLVGPNSAGKSSIIQSMLMIAQTGLSSGDLSLNGHLVELGRFGDIRSRWCQNNERIRIAAQTAALSPLMSYEGRLRRVQSGPSSAAFNWEILIDPDDQTTGAQIAEGSAELVAQGDVRSRVTFKRSTEQPVGMYGPYSSKWLDARLALREQLEDEVRDYAFLRFVAGFPIEGRKRWPNYDYAYEQVWQDINDVMQRRNVEPAVPKRLHGESGEMTDDDGAVDLDELAQHLWPLVRSVLEDLIESPQGGQRFERKRLNPRQMRQISLNKTALRERIAEQFARELLDFEGSEVRQDPNGMRMRSRVWSEGWMNFWANNVQYLGPLREEPMVVYKRNADRNSNTPIGKRGEAMAALHWKWADVEADFPLPVTYAPRRLKLQEAINIWIQEMELGSSVKSEDLGRHGLSLLLDDNVLTSVGTGVSQVLPVLLLCLTSSPNAVLLIEEPETHLHPKLQQSLAEFLLRIAQSGRQVIVETHSEYIVTRLRLLAAQDPETVSDFTIYFAELDELRQTEFRRVQVDSRGGIEDWPAGFFDQAGQDARRLFELAVSKRNRTS